MLLAALIDFPDDAIKIYNESTMDKMLKKLKAVGIDRVYFQYYGNRDYGYFWNHKAPFRRGTIKTANNMPEFSKVFVKLAKENDIEPVAVMRPQEQGLWITFSPYYKETQGDVGVPYTGGKIMIASKFLIENPELRIKRRTWDIDREAVNKKICAIKLYKQNGVHSRIKKQNIEIYVSDNNAHYKKYKGDFTLTYSYEKAKKDVITSGFIINYPTKTITHMNDDIEVLTLSELSINEKYVAIEVNCKSEVNSEKSFINTPTNAISILDKNNNVICASQGSANLTTPTKVSHLKAGFNFDDGFGENWPITLDKGQEKGYVAICKGKDEYVHGALCIVEPKVQKYLLEWLEKALDDGYEMIGNRIECHSVHVDEPFAYGYNDCIQKEYYKRYGQCKEKDMELKKIAKIRGDAYTNLFIESAKRIRARGKKVYLTLNVEMLYDPIPIARNMAYPMNVEWQWKRWLEEIQPDEINIRAYYTSIDFILNDSKCKNFIKSAQKYNVPLTLERYDYWDFAKEFETIQKTGIFSRMTLYEVNNIIQSDKKGGIVVIKPELLEKLKILIN